MHQLIVSLPPLEAGAVQTVLHGKNVGFRKVKPFVIGSAFMQRTTMVTSIIATNSHHVLKCHSTCVWLSLLGDRYDCDSHFTDENTWTRRAEFPCPKSYSQ